jgi:LmbE family N-acetylglucosaminyl deacetylase
MQILNKKRNIIPTRRTELINAYSSMGFNWHSVLRFQQDSKDVIKSYDDGTYQTKAYNQKIGSRYVDRVMDNLVKRKIIGFAMAFVEQDDYHNNHLHFTWSSPLELTREQVANSMRTNIKYIRDVKPIINVEDAVGYFTKRLGMKGSYHNIYSSK